MSLAYVDSSALVAIAFAEPKSRALARRIEAFERLYSSNLLEAELRAALALEGQPTDSDLVTWLHWVLPDRPLSAEIGRVLAAGTLRGADLWHLACALYLSGGSGDLTFVTLDERQRAVAVALGFET